MHYENESLGFSFILPDGWQEMKYAIPLTFFSDIGTIQIQAGDVLPGFTDSTSREKHLYEPGCISIPNKTLGGETNTVMIENNRHEGIISTVRDNLMYNITYINANNPVMQETIENLMVSFKFPPLDKWIRAIQKTSKTSPREKAITKSINRVIHGITPVPASSNETTQKQKSKNFFSRFFGNKKTLTIMTCETCSRQMQVLESTAKGGVTLSPEELQSGIHVAERCWECGRIYCNKCYPSRPPNSCVCGRGRTAVRRFKGGIQKGSLRLVKVRYIE